MIAEGNWKSRATGAYALGTARTGTEQIGVELVILEGPDTGSRITWYGYFTDKAFERAIESLRLLGWKGDDLSDLDGLGSTEVVAVIAHEEDQNGELRARVQWINDIGGVAMGNRMDAGEAKSFAARMKGRVLALGQGQGPSKRANVPSPRTGASGPVMPNQSDDDIPF